MANLQQIGYKFVVEGYQAGVDALHNAANAGKQFGTEAEGAAQKAKGLSDTLKTVLATAAGFGLGTTLIQGVGQLKAAFTGAISAASDLNESMSKAHVVFGNYSGDIDAFAATSARSFGISKQAAYEATGTFGNLFTAMGIGQKPAADLSVNLVKLGADLASFNNLSPQEVLEKLRSGLVGEVEPLRSLGIQLSQTVVEAKATELGFQKVNGQFEASALVQARYQLILEQTTTAQGDFARTSDGLANQQRILKAEMTDLAAKVGTVLLPVLTTVAGFLSGTLIPGIESFGGYLADNKGLLIAFGAAITLVLLPALTAASIVLAGFVAELLIAAAPVVALTVAIFAAYEAGKLLGENWDSIAAKAQDIAAAFVNVGQAAAAGLVDGFNAAKDAVSSFISELPTIIEEGAQNAGDWMLDIGRQVMSGMVDGLEDGADAAVSWVGRLPNRLEQGARDAGNWFYDIGRDAIQGFVDGMESKASDAVDWVTGLPGKFIDAIQSAADGHSPWGIMEPVGEDMVAGIQAGADAAMPSLASNVGQAVAGIAASAQTALAKALGVTLSGYSTGNLDLINQYANQMGILPADVYGPVQPKEGPFIGLGPADIALRNQAASAALRGGGGGGGGGSAATVAKTAVQQFTDAMTSALRESDLTKEFGDEGFAVIDAFAQSFDSPATAAKIPALVQKMVDSAKKAGVPDAEALGRALDDAIAKGLVSGDSQAVGAAIKALATNAGKDAITSLAQAMAQQAADSQVQDQLGSAGVSLMKVFSDGVDRGSEQTIKSVASTASSVLKELTDKLGPDDGGKLGDEFMGALNKALTSGAAADVAALRSIMAQIQTVMKGGVVDIANGVTYSESIVAEFAKRLGLSTTDVVKNFSVLAQSGVLAMVQGLSSIPAEVQKVIDEIISELNAGIISAGDAASRLKNILPGTGGMPGQHGASGEGWDVTGSGYTITGLLDQYGRPQVGTDISQLSPVPMSAGQRAAAEAAARANLASGGGYTVRIDKNGNVIADQSGQVATLPNPGNPNGAFAGVSSLIDPVTGKAKVSVYQQGTPFVPETQLAIVHRGEAVIPAAMNRPGLASLINGMATGTSRAVSQVFSFDFRGANMTGTPAQNEAMMRRVVRQEISTNLGRGAILAGVGVR